LGVVHVTVTVLGGSCPIPQRWLLVFIIQQVHYSSWSLSAASVCSLPWRIVAWRGIARARTLLEPARALLLRRRCRRLCRCPGWSSG
jgi:hypothetical protein